MCVCVCVCVCVSGPEKLVAQMPGASICRASQSIRQIVFSCCIPILSICDAKLAVSASYA